MVAEPQWLEHEVPDASPAELEHIERELFDTNKAGGGAVAKPPTAVVNTSGCEGASKGVKQP